MTNIYSSSPGKVALRGDALSQIIQFIAKQLKMSEWIQWLGRGEEDLKSVMVTLKNERMAKDELLAALALIMDNRHIKKQLEEDESLKAQVCGCVLRAKANIDLQMLHVGTLQAPPVTTVTL